ncbi:MAG: hypothetical protein IIU74_03100 [Ruminiclostridium sp.]|nr:hypothetical protein [Ruminiclostridium sp.]
MAEFEDTLNAILSDPDTMGQIMALAGKLGGGDPPPQTQEPPPEQPFPLPDLGQVGKLLELVQSCQGPDRQTMALVNALRPFLRPDRQEKLDRALRMAGLSQAARQAYQLWKEGELHV